jgi:hypothetical protein
MESTIDAGWGEDEALLTLAVLRDVPGEPFTFGERILELAELLGRSPGSVSFKTAGFRALDSGRSRGGSRLSLVQREVFRQFGHDAKSLQRRAREIRLKMLPALPSARAETESGATQNRFGRVVADLAHLTGFPASELHLYSWDRATVRGAALSATGIFSHPAAARALSQSMHADLARGLRVSAGFSQIEAGRFKAFMRGLVRWKCPSLHLAELDPSEIQRIAHVVCHPEIHSLSVTSRDAARAGPEELKDYRGLATAVIGVRGERLCDACALLVGYVAHQAERKLHDLPLQSPTA